MTIRPVGAEFFRADGRTDKHDEGISRFSQSCERAWKRSIANYALRDMGHRPFQGVF